MTVTYGATYGELPVPTKNGYGFIGWFTAAEGGEQITAESICNLTEDQTLYAQWRELVEIPKTVYDFGEAEQYVYERSVGRDVGYDFIPGEGAAYTANDFTFKFMRQGDSEYVDAPINAGTYNVTVSRPADNTYAKFEQTYTAVLQIAKAVRPEGTAEIELIDNGYTWMYLRLNNGDGGIYDLSDEAIITYQVGRTTKVPILDGFTITYQEKFVPVAQGEIGSIYVRDIPRNTAPFEVCVMVTDPNYEDWISTPYTSSELVLREDPTEAWTNTGYYDISWYEKNPNASSFVITKPQMLAGVAYLVNNGIDDFDGQEIRLAGNIDMRGFSWNPIGTESRPFKGFFNGNGRTISGIFCSWGNKYNVGLFGYASGEAEIANLVLDDAIVHGKAAVGGILGYAAGDTCIWDCVSYAYVSSLADGNESKAGGIVGNMKCEAFVTGCVNYGPISGTERHVGGIVGRVECGGISDCVNFGSVSGHSRLGGIAGCTDGGDAYVFNCYNVGRVHSSESNDYIGAIVGRNTNNKGDVEYIYYKEGCATDNEGESCNALGGADDGSHGYYASSFNDPLRDVMKDTAEDCTGMLLLDALNYWWQEEETPNPWEIGPDGYPLFVSTPVSALRK